MSISFLAILHNNHALRYKYLRGMLEGIRQDDDELIVINIINNYRQTESISLSEDKWIKTIDLFNISDDFKAKMIASGHAKNDYLCFLDPYGLMSKDGRSKAIKYLNSGDGSSIVFGNCYKINPFNGLYYKSLNKSNISINSLIFHKNSLDGFKNNSISTNISLYQKLSSEGQTYSVSNDLEYLEFIKYDGFDVVTSAKCVGESQDKKVDGKISKILKSYKKIIIS